MKKYFQDFPGSASGEGSPASAGDTGDSGSIPGSGGGNSNPLQYSCLENPLKRTAWGTTTCGVAISWTRLSNKPRMQTVFSVPDSIFPFACFIPWSPKINGGYFIPCKTPFLNKMEIWSLKLKNGGYKVQKQMLVLRSPFLLQFQAILPGD